MNTEKIEVKRDFALNITQVEYEACFNLGNYENERIRLVHEVLADENEEIEVIVDALRKKVCALTHPSKEDLLAERYSLRRERDYLRGEVENARQEWEKSARFMVAQGLKSPSEVPSFPSPALLNPVSEESEWEVI
jgi:hypothetical protein